MRFINGPFGFDPRPAHHTNIPVFRQLASSPFRCRGYVAAIRRGSRPRGATSPFQHLNLRDGIVAPCPRNVRLKLGPQRLDPRCIVALGDLHLRVSCRIETRSIGTPSVRSSTATVSRNRCGCPFSTQAISQRRRMVSRVTLPLHPLDQLAHPPSPHAPLRQRPRAESCCPPQPASASAIVRRNFLPGRDTNCSATNCSATDWRIPFVIDFARS